MLHGRTEIAGFQPKLYKTLQKMASKTTSYTHEINGFGVVKGEPLLTRIVAFDQDFEGRAALALPVGQGLCGVGKGEDL